MSDDLVEMTDCLKTAREALEQKLIESGDYDQVKAAFLRAQQIRAGLDAGFIRQDDYDQIKQTFLQSLQGMSDSPSSHSQRSMTSKIEKDDEEQAPPAPALAAAAPQASQNGRQTNRLPSFSQPAAPNSLSHPPAPVAPSGSVTSGGATIPADIPKMGGNRPKHLQGVRKAARGMLLSLCLMTKADKSCLLQTSMSGIAVTEDAVNLYYYMKAKSVVCALLFCRRLPCFEPTSRCLPDLQYRWALWKLNDAGNEVSRH